MSARKMDTETRQQQIAEAALAVVAAQGVKALSVAAVAERVGLVPSALYRHFKSKEEVLNAVLDLIASRLRTNVRMVCEEMDDPVERLRELLMRHAKLISENEAILSVVFSDEIYGVKHQRQQKAGALLQGYLADVERIVRDGQRRGRIRQELRARTVAMMYLGIIQPAAIILHLEGKTIDLAKHARDAWKLLQGAIVVN